MMHDLMHNLPAFLVALRHTHAFGKLISFASMTPVHLPLGPSPALARRSSQKRCGEGTWALEAGSCEMRLDWHFIHPHCFFLNYFIVKVKVTRLRPTLCNPIDYTVHGILQARTVEWVAFPFSRGSFQPRYWSQVFCVAGGFFTSWATREGISYWRITNQQHCDSFRWTAEGLSRTRTCIPSPPDSLPI